MLLVAFVELMPEAAATLGWRAAVSMAAFAASVLALVQQAFT